MYARRRSIILLLILALMVVTACQNDASDVTGDVASDVNQTEEPKTQHTNTESQDKEESVDTEPEEILPILDIKIIESHFEGEEGAFVIKAMNDDKFIVFNEGLANTALPPCSTFKIPNALIGLELGVVKDKNTMMKWDGTEYWNKDWNRDHTLESAIEYSTVWYFKKLAKAVGMDNMQKYLNEMDYGNADISGGIDKFWLDSSLKITAFEQVEFLEKFYKKDLPFREENLNMVKEMIVLENLGCGTLSGKTGTGNDGGWFVGYCETPREVYLFSAYIKKKQGKDVKKIVIDILEDGKLGSDL